jgi:peptidyl-prolyl cis-trans isomerase D
MFGGSGQKGVMSIVYGAIVFAILMVFVIQFRPKGGEQTGSLKRQCAANIRDRCIDPKEFFAALGLIAPRGMDDQRMKAMGIRRQVIEGLVERTLLVQDAARLGVTVTEREVKYELVRGRFHVSLPVKRADLRFYLGLSDEMVRLMPVTNPQTKKFDDKIFQRTILSATNRSPEKFIEMQTEELLAARMRALISSRAYVSDAEAFAAYAREKSNATLDYVTLSRAWFRGRYLDTSAKKLEQWTKNNQAEVDKTWEARKAEYQPGCRRIRHIVVAVKSDTSPLRGHTREEAQSIIEKALERVRSGEDFGKVAEEISEDPVSKAKGGDLGCNVRGKWAKELEDVEFAMKKPGDISDVVETPMGLHVIKLEAVMPDDAKKAEQAGRAMVAEELMSAFEVENLLTSAAGRIRDAVVAGKTLDQATAEVIAALDRETGYAKRAEEKAKAEKAKPGDKTDDDGGNRADVDRPKVQTTPSFTPDDTPIEGVERGTNVAAMAFATAKPGDPLADLIKVSDGYVLAQLKEKKLATREEFDKERDAYTERFTRAKAHDVLNSYVARLRDKASSEIRVNDIYAREPKDKDSDE